ncbi:MAG: beta-ketoacyl synthase N-terminal-like domain-containing protein [Balneolaceae bacterium]
MNNKSTNSAFDIAIIGMAGRFPKAKNIHEYWENLKNGRECFTQLNDEQIIASGVNPELLKDPDYVKVSPILDDYDKFDAQFFGYTPREGSMMDPQQRLFLECCWEAFEDAGYNPHAYEEPVGVFGGCAINSYMIFSGVHNRFYTEFLPSVVGNDNSFLANRVSYQLNLNGPAVTVQTACSSSLVSVHLSIQSLLNGECTMALAGGVAVWVPHEAGHLHKEGGIFTKDGHCRAFDAKATGTIFGNGAGVVLLKRLDDAIRNDDTIYAVIKGSAINNDGAKKTDYTAPSVDGQANVIVEALANAGVNADDISYVETHGTGTFIGDPIEIRALSKAYKAFTNRKGYCGIGSVKPNIGHLDAGAGAAGLIKTVMALKHKMIPPSINFDEPNPAIDFENSPFYVNTILKTWESKDGSPLLAGVTSLGMGGTNAHIILQEAPVIKKPIVEDQWPLLLTYSAKKESALDDYSAKLAKFLKTSPNTSLPNVAYTLQTGRKEFPHKRFLIAENRDDAIKKLEKLPASSVKTFSDHADGREVVFLFPGQASQYVNMGLNLYRSNSLFKKHLDNCAEILMPIIDVDIRNVIFPESGHEEMATNQLQNTVYTQPAIFSIEYSLAMYWMDLGIKPVAVLGHSMGEFTAACIAGVFDLETGLKLIAMRGSIMQELEPGSMLTVMMPPSEVEKYLNERLSISVINTPSSCVVSGDTEAIEDLKNIFDGMDVHIRLLETSHAFHSHMMDPVLEKYRNFVSTVTFSPPSIPVISTVTADWTSPNELTTPDYWMNNIRQPVRFAEAVEKLFDRPEWILLEVGPRNTLTTLAKQHPEISLNQIVVQSMRHPKQSQDDNIFAMAALGRLWSCGYPVEWKRVYKENPVYKIPIPTYAFQRVRCWVDPEILGSGLHQKTNNEHTIDDVDKQGSEKRNIIDELTAIWEEFLGIEHIKKDDNFFDLGGNSLVALQLFDELKRKLGIRLPLSALFEAPTIEQIAELIEPEVSEVKKVQPKKDHSSVLVKIQAEGIERPFFCIHGHFGNVLFFYELAKLLGKDRPFYGVQSVGLSGEEDPLTSIEAMADRIIQEMKEVQPTGPYSFGGYCYGTLVSMEIAKKLDEMGETYDPIVMIDPQPPAFTNVLDEEVIKSFKKISFKQRKGNHKSKLGKSITQSVRYLWHKITDRLAFKSKIKAFNMYIRTKDFININMPAALRDVELANRVALDNYTSKLKRDFKADVELLLSKEVTEKISSDPTSDWAGFTKGHLNIHLIEDDGFIMSGEMFKQPYVHGTAEVIRSIWESQPAVPDTNKSSVVAKSEKLNHREKVTL